MASPKHQSAGECNAGGKDRTEYRDRRSSTVGLAGHGQLNKPMKIRLLLDVHAEPRLSDTRAFYVLRERDSSPSDVQYHI